MVIKSLKQQRNPNLRPPVFEKLPIAVQFVVGGDAVFECKVEGNPQPQVIWSRKGITIENDDRRRVSYDPITGTTKMIIKKMTLNDDGEYRCIAVNSEGEASLSVNINKQQLQQATKSTATRRVESVKRTVSSTTIFDIKKLESFEYRLVNDVDFRKNIFQSIRVRETHEQEHLKIPNYPIIKPEIVEKLRNIKAFGGIVARIEAKINGNPPPSIFWFKNGEKIYSDNRIRVMYNKSNGAVLEIHNSSPQDSGYYTVMGTNDLGTVVSSAQILIEPLSKVERFIQNEPTFAEPEPVNLTLKPQFLKIPSSANVKEGKMIRFDCRVGGRPSPDVFWYLNGQQIFDDPTHKILVNEGGIHSLMITNVSLYDNGNFTCIAKNRNGESRFDVELSVDAKTENAPPSFVKKFNSVRIKNGEPLQLYCKAVGSPIPNIIWQRDSNELQNSPPNLNIETIQGTSQLFIPSASESDGGWYQATATNGAGSVSTQARIHVELELPPESGPQPLNFPKPTRIIQRERSPSPETIFLRHVERTAPHIPCLEEDPQFTDKPIFTSPFRELKLEEFSKAEFDTRLLPIGDPSMIVEWYHNGKILEASSRIITTYRFGYVALQIISVSMEDAGEYICRAINLNGEAVNRTILNVNERESIDRRKQYPGGMEAIRHLEDLETYDRKEIIEESIKVKPRFIIGIKSLDKLQEGDTAKFEGKIAPDNDPNLTVEWFLNNHPLTAGSRITTIYNLNCVALVINSLRKEDSGIYRCQLTNEYGQAISTATLKVLVDSRVTSDLGIKEQKNFIKKTQQLEEHRIKKMKHEFEDMEVDVNQKPTFKTTLYNIKDVPEGRTVHIECTLEPQGDPNMKVDWFKDGRPLEASSRITPFYNFGYVSLSIVNAEERDTGIYTCVSTNKLGKNQSSCEVTVKDLKKTILLESEHKESLEQIKHLEDSEKFKREEMEEIEIRQKPIFVCQLYGPEDPLHEGMKAHFETRIEPANDPNLTIEWYFNGQPLTSGHRFRTFFDFGYAALDVLYVFPMDQGTFSIKAKNKLGEAVASKNIDVIALKSIDRTTIHGKAYPKIQALESKKYPHIEEYEEDYEHPMFVSPLKGTEKLIEGEAAHFECRVKPIGDPDLKVLWFHNGQEMTTGSRFKYTQDFGFIALDIASVLPHDAGIYTSLVINAKGEAQSSISLDIKKDKTIITDLGIEEQQQYIQKTQELEAYKLASHKKAAEVEQLTSEAPIFTNGIRDQLNIPENKIAHFEATLIPAGDPTMKVEWFHNGKPLEASSRVQTFFNFGFVSMTMKEVMPRDEGIYTCKATNCRGSAVTEAKLSCLAYGSIDLGTQYEGGMEKIRQLEDASKFQRPEYVDAEIDKAPMFLRPLEGPDELVQGQTAHFETRLEPVNDPNMIIEWYHNGKLLPVGHRFKTFYDFGYIALDILYVYPEDTGTFKVMARNKLGQAETEKGLRVTATSKIDTTTLHDQSMGQIQALEGRKTKKEALVIEKDFDAPIFITPLVGPSQLIESQFAHFECRVTPIGDPNLRIIWYHNGVELRSGSRFNYLNDMGYVCLDIASVTPADTGTYICKAVNNKGEAHSSIGFSVLTVNTIITDLGIPEQKNYIEKTQELEDIQRLAKQQSSFDVDLISKQPPKFINEIKDILDVLESHTIHFEATVSPQNDSGMILEWFKDNSPIEASSRISTFFNFGYVSLTIRDVDSRDSGIYTCKASNIIGTAITTASLSVIDLNSIITDTHLENGTTKLDYLEQLRIHRDEFEYQEIGKPPKFIKELVGPEKVIEGDSIHFETRLTPVNDPKLFIEWHFNGKPLASGHRFRTFHDFGYVALDILYMYPEDSGEYVARAFNEFGEDIVKISIICKARQSIIYHSQLPKEMEKGVIKIAELEASLNRSENSEEAIIENSAPEFVMKPEPQVVFEGESAKFQVRVTGHPRPKLMWIINGNTIINGSRYKLRYDGIYHLEVPKSRQYDTGKVEVYIRNIKGEAYAWTTFDVKPRHDDYRVVLHTSPRPWYDEKDIMNRYQRDRKESELERVFEERLTPGGTEILEYQTKEQDYKRVKVKQYHDEREVLAMQPEVHRYKTDVFYIDKKSDIKEIRKDNESEVKWMKKSYEGKIDPGSMKEEKEIIKSIQRQTQHEMRGDVEIRRDLKAIEMRVKEQRALTEQRRVQEIMTKGEAPLFTRKISPCKVKEGETAIFEANFTGKPPPTITWYRENFAIQNSRDFQIETDATKSTLTIREVYIEDSGVFSVKAENKGGSAKNSTNLVVEETKELKGAEALPVFLKTIQDIKVNVGQLARLDAIVSGPKPIQINWLKNQIKIAPDISHKIFEEDNQQTLLILETTPEDDGIYECVANNKAGETRCKAVVKIVGKEIKDDKKFGKKEKAPEITEKLKNISVKEGSSVVLRAKISNAKPNQVNWYKADCPIKQSRYFRMGNDRDVFTLKISEAFPEDEGCYRCIAKTPSGTATTDALLRIIRE